MNQELIPTSLPLEMSDGSIAQDWEMVIEAFLNTRETESTRRTYAPTLRTFAKEFAHVTGPALIAPQELGEWAMNVRNDVEAGVISPNTGKRKVMTVKSFFKFAYTIGQSRLGKDLRAFVLKPPREQVLKPFQVLNADDQDKLLGAATGQDRRIVAALLYAGLRASELCKLRVSDYYADDDGLCYLVVRGKGGKVREVPVGDKLAPGLGPVNPRGDGTPLFPSRQGDGFYSRVRIFQIVDSALAQAGIERRISPHSLRHTAAMTWLKAGVPLPVIQRWLGHASLATTQKYVDHLEKGEAHGYMP